MQEHVEWGLRGGSRYREEIQCFRGDIFQLGRTGQSVFGQNLRTYTSATLGISELIITFSLGPAKSCEKSSWTDGCRNVAGHHHLNQEPLEINVAVLFLGQTNVVQ